jgi:hypothetical protein
MKRSWNVNIPSSETRVDGAGPERIPHRHRASTFFVVCFNLLLLSCDGSGAPSSEVEPDPVAAVQIAADTVSLSVGDSAQLTAHVLSTDGAEISSSVAWTVGDTLIVDPITSTDREVTAAARRSGSTWVIAEVSSVRDSVNLEVRDTAGAPKPGAAGCDTSKSNLSFYGNFEQPSPFTDWDLGEASAQPWSHAADTLHRECAGSIRIELRNSDPEVAGSFRSEIKLSNTDTLWNGGVSTPEGMTPIGRLGSEVWWGWSIYIPADWIFEEEYAPETLMQVSQTGRSPAFSIGIDGEEFYTDTRYGYGDQGAATITTVVTSRTPVNRGAWTDWVVHARWSGENDGLLEIWKNGTKIVTRAGPNTYSDWSSRPYPKWGIYKWSWADEGSLVTRRYVYINRWTARKLRPSRAALSALSDRPVL